MALVVSWTYVGLPVRRGRLKRAVHEPHPRSTVYGGWAILAQATARLPAARTVLLGLVAADPPRPCSRPAAPEPRCLRCPRRPQRPALQPGPTPCPGPAALGPKPCPGQRPQ